VHYVVGVEGGQRANHLYVFLAQGEYVCQGLYEHGVVAEPARHAAKGAVGTLGAEVAFGIAYHTRIGQELFQALAYAYRSGSRTNWVL
jgi:hypothetical protein